MIAKITSNSCFVNFKKGKNNPCNKGGPQKLKYHDLGGGDCYMGPQALSHFKYNVNTIPTLFKCHRYLIEHELQWVNIFHHYNNLHLQIIVFQFLWTSLITGIVFTFLKINKTTIIPMFSTHSRAG